jgi:hypothetical protein
MRKRIAILVSEMYSERIRVQVRKIILTPAKCAQPS